MHNQNTSPHDDQETKFIVPEHKEIDWKATQWNFFHLAKISYHFTVVQCDKYITHDDMRDPNVVIIESLRDNIEPVTKILDYCEKMGMPGPIAAEIRSCDWLNMTKEDVIEALSTDAKAMRTRKIRLRKQREEHRMKVQIASVE